MISLAHSVLVLHSSPTLLSALKEGAGAARVQVVADWDALERALHRSPITAVAVVDPFRDGDTGAPSPRLLALLDQLRSASVVAAFPVSTDTLRHLDGLTRAGLADVIDVGHEDTPVALRVRLQTVQRRRAARLVERALPRSTPGRTRALLGTAAETVITGGGGAELAEALGANERTVLRWCRRADLPHPRRLLAWLRILLAADMLDDPGRALSAVANAAGYSSDAALRNAMRAFLGTSPSTLRGTAFSTAAAAFSRELFDLREAAHARGRPEKTWLN